MQISLEKVGGMRVFWGKNCKDVFSDLLCASMHSLLKNPDRGRCIIFFVIGVITRLKGLRSEHAVGAWAVEKPRHVSKEKGKACQLSPCLGVGCVYVSNL